jgi:hypothetical protein
MTEVKREGQFENGDIWTGYSYKEEPGLILYEAIDENGEEYVTEEIPTRDVLDFGLIQFDGVWTREEIDNYFKRD